jgi:hypothetical protein
MAAGLGFKTFTSGEVLTAADTNGYLMQGVMVFASASARTAAITAPTEGQYSYLKDTNSTEYYDGAAWVAGVEGDISGVTAGVGISGGGTSGTVTVTNSMATTITTKGDLVPGTGSGTFARIAVGANDTMLVGDSTAATGLSYKSAATLYPWTTWSPTLGGVTKGNGTEIARYAKIGKTVIFNYSFTLGSTSAVTGNFSITLPSTAANAAYGVTCWADDNGVAAYSYLPVPSTTSISFYPVVTSGAYASGGSTSATVPFVWGNTDSIRLSGHYEEA